MRKSADHIYMNTKLRGCQTIYLYVDTIIAIQQVVCLGVKQTSIKNI